MNEYTKVLSKCNRVIDSCTNINQLKMSSKYCTRLVNKWHSNLIPNTHEEKTSYRDAFLELVTWIYDTTKDKRMVLSAKG